jgi:hypothetical protein
MAANLLLGTASLVIAAALVFIGLPGKGGHTLRFVRAETGPMIYPAVILVFIAVGAAEVITVLLAAGP